MNEIIGDATSEVPFDLIHILYILRANESKSSKKLFQLICSLSWSNSINRITDHNF